MPRKKVSERLTVRVFLITASLLLFAGAITFGFIAWAAPSTYTAVMNDDLAAQMDVLVEQLADTAPEDCGKLLGRVYPLLRRHRHTDGPDGRLVDTGAQIALQAVYESGDMIVTTAERDTAVSFGTTDSESGDHVSVTMSEQSTIAAEVRFFRAGGELYTLCHPTAQSGECGGAGAGTDGPVASAGAADLFSAVRPFFIPGTSPGPLCG